MPITAQDIHTFKRKNITNDIDQKLEDAKQNNQKEVIHEIDDFDYSYDIKNVYEKRGFTCELDFPNGKNVLTISWPLSK